MAVLQGWSKSTMSGRMTGIAFLLVFGTAAVWGLRTLIGVHR